MKTTQEKLILDYVKEFGSITPAVASKTWYKGQWLSPSIDRACRALSDAHDTRNPFGKQLLEKEDDPDHPRCKRFYLKEEYCACSDSHLSVPGNIETAHCVYCNKPPYGITQEAKQLKII